MPQVLFTKGVMNPKQNNFQGVTEMTKQKILIPLDTTDFSKQILPEVQRLHPPERTEIVLFQVGEHQDAVTKKVVSEPETLPAAPIVGGTVPVTVTDHAKADEQLNEDGVKELTEPEDSYRQLMLRDLEREAQQFKQAGYKVSKQVRVGDPAEQIAQFAKAEDVDLVAMSTHNRSGLKKLLFGNTADQLIDELPMPVLLIQPQNAQQL